ncbi:MAG: GGGtGRT protein, partial [Clostridiales Family XIII bacterium]|nr:GGGtGRT protein [Clostridiales Family XIII bacterium]
MATFESYERRIAQIEPVLAEYGIGTLDDALALCTGAGFDPREIVKGIQPIAFENAGWAYTLGAAIALKKGTKGASAAASDIGIGLQAFCIPGSVADDRRVG